MIGGATTVSPGFWGKFFRILIVFFKQIWLNLFYFCSGFLFIIIII